MYITPELLRSALVEYCRIPPLPLPDHITNDQVELMSSLIPSLPISPIARVAIDRLPVSLLSHVFTYLRALDDLLDSVRLVSRTWNDIVILPGSCPHLKGEQNQFRRIGTVVPKWLHHVKQLSINTHFDMPIWFTYLQSISQYD
jgi:hypothetical protein